LYIIGVNSNSAVQRTISVSDILKDDKSVIPMRDLTINKKSEAGDADKGLTEKCETECLQADAVVHIEDITSSKVQIIDNFDKIFQVYEGLIYDGTNFAKGEFLFQNMLKKVFLPWNRFDRGKKEQLFSQYACHELNFFIYKRDKVFYYEVVYPLIQNKLEKTFVDWYLIGIEPKPN
jgi:hypothetical protein